MLTVRLSHTRDNLGEEEIKDLIRLNLCWNYCYRQDKIRGAESCREIEELQEQPYLWCENCMRSFLQEVMQKKARTK